MRPCENSLPCANYDLIYAQTISYQLRLQEYGWYLAEFIKTPKAIKNPRAGSPDQPSARWHGEAVAQARCYAIRVCATRPMPSSGEIQKEYAGTPWAWLATEELGRGYGIELHEDFEDPRSRGVKVPKY